MPKNPFPLRGLALLAPMAPAAALILFAAAGAAAQGAAGRNALVDLQIGEEGRFLRVAVLCKTECPSRARAGGGFFLPGLDAALEIDLQGRTKNASRIALTPAEGGTLLTLASPAPVRRAAINPCEIGDARATCIDIEFGAKEAVAAAPALPQRTDERAPMLGAAELAPQGAPASDAKGAPAQGERPALREAPAEKSLVFASLAPPERFTPPGAAAQKPAIVDPGAAAPQPIDIRDQAKRILGKEYGVAECGGARARLRADAWALDAMVDVGFCDAIAGKLDEADGVFLRLLAYTPDNYEALVGRGLIAAKRGGRAEARAFFQDALNALPPIAESDRIVAAMKTL